MSTKTLQQESISLKLSEQFNIDPERILFLNEKNPEEPWLSAEALVTIARQTGNFQTIDESYDQLIVPLNQVVHRATVIDREGRTYSRCGIATIGEREDIDDHALAAGRAISAALTAAGFNPLRPGAVVTLDLTLQSDSPANAAEAQSRNADLKRIHKIAEVKGLITRKPGGGWDRTGYRQFLTDNYKTNTAAAFDALQRASLINALERLQDAVVDEFAEVAA